MAPVHQLDIIIVGAGLAGLGAAIGLARKGHKVTVLEGATSLTEGGSGIQVPPNATRVINSYGLTPKFLPEVMLPEAMHFLRFDTGITLGEIPLNPKVVQVYGSP
jgi:2-polyprenyl-6-methoxyphenol hydroxylase-like FAD-dependent oxidoreductase